MELVAKKVVLILFLAGLFLISLTGCMKLALRSSPTLLQNFSDTVFEECDPDLAGDAIPANLMLMEGLLKSDPKNRKILTLLSMGFSGYGMLFMENTEPERASQFYLRARQYGIRALGEKGDALVEPGAKIESIQAALETMGTRDFEALFWTAVSWNAWINLNLDKPTALSQLGASKACLERILEMNESYLYGFPHILIGTTLAATPPMLGGDPEGAKAHFEKALALGERKFFLAQYYFARYYTTRAQDKKLFFKLLDEVISGDPQDLKDVCLINTIIQSMAGQLRETADDLFF
jgi:tetratricopeptide (TPR) repeat protein